MKKNMVFYDPEEARILGLTQAVIYYQLRYWINFNEKRNQNYHDGCYWTFFNIKNLEDLLGVPSKTLYDNLIKLESKGYIKTGNYNKLKFDRTKWYALTETKPLEVDKDIPYLNNRLPIHDYGNDNSRLQNSQFTISDDNTREVKYSNNNSNNSSKNNSNISSNTNSTDFLTHQYSEQEFFEDYLKRKGLV